MKIKNSTRKYLWISTIQTIALGVYHFWLPYQWQWKNYIQDIPPTIGWALFSLNDYFSMLIVLVGAVLAIGLYQKLYQEKTFLWLLRATAAFWVFDIIYLWLTPMPLPQTLFWIQPLLIMVPVLNLLLIVLGISGVRKALQT